MSPPRLVLPPPDLALQLGHRLGGLAAQAAQPAAHALPSLAPFLRSQEHRRSGSQRRRQDRQRDKPATLAGRCVAAGSVFQIAIHFCHETPPTSA